MTNATVEDYPVRFDVEYPDMARNRVTVAFRLFMLIPIAVVLALLSGPGFDGGGDGGRDFDADERVERRIERDPEAAAGLGVAAAIGGTAVVATGIATAAGVVIAPTVLMLLFRRKYPRWWFDWNREISRFATRVNAYGLLLRDEYPSTDEEQAVRLDIDYPEAQQLSRWLPLVKWLLAIPHYVLLLFLGIATIFVAVFAWFAILLTGRYPRGLFDFVVGVQRWSLRVSGYAFLLVTDRYPPFSVR